MQTLSIDIETYSDVNLSKCGVYKYAESPDFEILLFGYSADGSEVTVIDLAQGERLPQEIIDALTDDTVIKWAFNANFERVCLSRYLLDLGVSLDPFHDNHPLSTECARFLNPESWRCSMVWAATMGLPLSLEGVGAVLGLEKQKLTEGKDLIKYFSVPCAPTKANGGRTRNHPFHAPDKWEAFKKYNIRDVETEIGIKDRLAKFPVPEEVWDEYHIDQEINDRGVRLDMDLVKEAIEMDSRSRSELTTAMKDMTALDNPNSVQQMKQWLSDNGLETDSLGKKVVAELIKTAPPELQTVLELRQQLSTEYEVQLSDSERSRYEDLKQELILQLPDGEVTAANAASLTGKLSQLANGAIYADTGEVIEFHDRKLDALEDIIEAANEKPLLVAYWFRHDLSRIKNRFNVREIKTSRDIADWNAGKIPVAVIHPASAGHGLNLQVGGSTLVWFGLTWSLELYQQTNARLWRQGQESGTVVIQHIITKGTIDERIVKALSKKEMTQTALIDAVKADLEVV